MTLAWTLEARDGGTRLRLEHTGFQGVGGVLLSFMMGSWWKKKLHTTVVDIFGRNGGGNSARPASAA